MTNQLFRDYLDGKIRCPRQARADHRRRIEQRIEQFSKVVNDAMPMIVEAFKQYSDSVNAVAEIMRSAGLIEMPPPTQPRERALWAMKHSNTGPPPSASWRGRGRVTKYARG